MIEVSLTGKLFISDFSFGCHVHWLGFIDARIKGKILNKTSKILDRGVKYLLKYSFSKTRPSQHAIDAYGLQYAGMQAVVYLDTIHIKAFLCLTPISPDLLSNLNTNI